MTSDSRMRARGTGDFNKPMSRHELMVVFLKVLSKSVSDALAYLKNPETEETQRFIVMMDRFFDCLSVRSMHECTLKRKPDIQPYFSPDDTSFDVSWDLYCPTSTSLNFKVVSIIIAVVEKYVFEVS